MSSWRVATHTFPDLDALSASAAVFWIVGQEDPTTLLFWDGAGDPPLRHDPGSGDVIVDIGGANAFDHHHLPDPRSTCAFALVVDFFAASENESFRARAQSLIPLKPALLRQDRTGALFSRDDDDRVSIANALRALAWQESDDAATWRWFFPVLTTIFSSVAQSPQDVESLLSWRTVAHLMRTHGNAETAERIGDALERQLMLRAEVRSNPALLLPLLTDLHVLRDPPLVAYACESVVGAWTPVLHDREALAALFPHAAVLISQKRWMDRTGGDRTWSLNVGRALTDSGRLIDVPILHRLLCADDRLPAPIRSDMATWYVESWFCGRGSLKRPTLRPPPHAFILETVRSMTRMDRSVFAERVRRTR